ncbi:histidine kinase dimerization/phosphoacceptor domain -containing protein [Maridesulfovibrio sp.]|uniref:histidine kinase dimerization/phosphoacceptor domain -containing protein n=1 Tax=Maridesulfovibrio sp. TaxID=2795000 RepID=UPI002A188BB0|nr:histidine kinase dimerization/phosphoacceptor domain -containing protein [Maridesulfovibrio sp.]
MNTYHDSNEGSPENDPEQERACPVLAKVHLRHAPGSGLGSSGHSDCRTSIGHCIRLVENIDQGVLVFDQSNEIVFMNRSACDLLETELSAFNIAKFQSLFPAKELQLFEKHFSSAWTCGHVEKCDCRLQLPSGNPLDLRLKFVPLSSSGGRPEGMQVIIADITFEYKIMQELKQSERMSRALFDGAGDAIFVHGVNGRFTDVNKVACERLGYSRAELLTMTPAEIRADSSDTFFAGLPDRAGRAKGVEEVYLVTKDGTQLPVEVNSRMICLGGKNKMLTIARDIAERVDAYKTSALNRKRFKALYEMAHMNETSIHAFFEFAIRHGIELSESEYGFIVRLEGHGSSVQFHDWISMDRAGISGIIPKPDNLAECGSWVQAITGRTSFYCNNVDQHECLQPFPDGLVDNYLALSIFEAGRVVAVAVVAKRNGDYTGDNLRNLELLFNGMWNVLGRRKSEQQLRQSLREKETLLKEVHHRVKNNMQVICSLLNLQTDYISDPKDLTLIRHSIDRVRSMAYVHEQLYRSDDLTSIDFGQYISGLGLKLFSSYGVANTINFSTRLEAIMLPIEQALPCGLIVSELITNAISHAFPQEYADKPKQVSVELFLEGDLVIISVADNGVGLANGLERSGSLGHVLIDTLVSQIGGTLERKEDKGARFIISFRAR